MTCYIAEYGRNVGTLQGGCSLSSAAKVSEQVVAEGVAQVGSQVLNGTLTSHLSLDEEAEHGEHGKAAVLDLLHLEEIESVRVLRQAKGIEAATRVQLVQVL